MEINRYRENPIYNRFIAIFIAFCGRAITIISFIYGVTLFLSSYPPIWLAYFFISNHALGISLSYPLSFLLGKERQGKWNSLIILFLAATIFAFFSIILRFDFYWLPFFISSSVGVIGSICEGVMTSAIPFGFNLREYKRVAQYTERAGILSVIAASFMIPLLTAYFPLDSLLVASIIFLVGSSFFLYLFTFLPQPHIKKKATPSNSLFSNSISKQVAFFVILSTITWKFIEYTFQYELAQYYTDKGLADFQGYYSGITNILGLVVAFSSTKYLLTHLRPGAMLYITQALTLLGSLLAIFIPSAWTIYLLAAIRIVFYYNYANVSFDIFLNIIPSAVRMIDKFKIKIVIPSIANMSAALFLLLVSAGYLDTEGLIVICSLITFLTFYFIKKIVEEYKNLLGSEANFKRFNTLENLSQVNTPFIDEAIANALDSTHPSIILLGLELLRRRESGFHQLPVNVFQHLDNEDSYVRKAVIELINRYSDIDALPYLQAQLAKENDSAIRFTLLETLANLDPDIAIKLSKDSLQKSNSSDYPSAIYILLTYGKSDEAQSAVKALHQLVKNPSPFLREKGAFIIRASHLKEFEEDLLELIADPDEHVSSSAIETIAKMNAVSLIPLCLKYLNRKTIKKFARHLDAAAVPYIVEGASLNENRSLLYKLLASIPGNEAEEALESFLNEENTFSRFLLSKEINYRACVYGVSEKFKESVKNAILKEVKWIEFFNDLFHRYSDERIQSEIRSRIKLSKECYLYWIGIITDPVQVNKLIPILIKSESLLSLETEKEKALELLEIHLNDHTLFSQVLAIFDSTSRRSTDKEIEKDIAIESMVQEYGINDPWLDRLINLEESKHSEWRGKEMDVILKVFNLRKIELFKDLPGEVLFAIGEESESLSFNEGEVIFREGDVPDALYCICTGKVKFYRQDKELNCLNESDFFGELGLIDGELRSATAVAETDCVLLSLEKNTFDRMTEDLPEIMLSISRTILHYYRKGLASSSS